MQKGKEHEGSCSVTNYLVEKVRDAIHENVALIASSLVRASHSASCVVKLDKDETPVCVDTLIAARLHSSRRCNHPARMSELYREFPRHSHLKL
jgi:hypothetical protein